MKLVLGLVVSMTVIAVAVFGFMVPWVEEHDDSSGIFYDDYLVIEGAVEASGSLEMVTIKDVIYVHAKDTGPGTITYSDGKTVNHTVKKAILDVIYLYGQSNAKYVNAVPSEAVQPPLGVGFYFGTATKYAGFEWSEYKRYAETGFWTFYDENGDLRVGDKGPAIVTAYYETTGHKVYLVDGAQGGREVSQFQYPDGSMWKYGKWVFQRALGLLDYNHFEVHTGPYIWIQGEANGGTPISNYQIMFLNMHYALLAGEYGYPITTCYVSLIRSDTSPPAALVELSETIPSIVIATDIARTFTQENGLLGPDGVHYSQAGNNILGTILGTVIGDDAKAASYDSQKVMDFVKLVPLLVILGLVSIASCVIIRQRH